MCKKKNRHNPDLMKLKNKSHTDWSIWNFIIEVNVNYCG